MNILTEKQYKSYDRVSRYSVFPYYYNRLDNKYVYGVTSHLITEGKNFVTHIVEPGDTLDTLSLYYYNNPTYYWIIADFNKIQDPYEKLEVGAHLKVPTFSHIEFDI